MSVVLLADAKAQLNIEPGFTNDDTLIQEMIDAAEDWITKFVVAATDRHARRSVLTGQSNNHVAAESRAAVAASSDPAACGAPVREPRSFIGGHYLSGIAIWPYGPDRALPGLDVLRWLPTNLLGCKSALRPSPRRCATPCNPRCEHPGKSLWTQ